MLFRSQALFLLILGLAIMSLGATPAPFEIPSPLQNLGESVNTRGDELYPTVSQDGKRIIFAAKRNGQRFYDLYETTFDETRGWQAPVLIPEVNSPYNDESPFLSTDGTLLVFASDRDGSKEMEADARGNIRVSFDLYWSRKVGGKWSRPVALPGSVNTKDHERFPALSADKTKLYYSSWPFGDLERSRIMVSELSGGKFGPGKILPESINSGNREVQFFPVPGKDGFILSSSRPGGEGGWDLYFVPMQNGEPGTPVNLGPTVNTPGNEAAASVSQDGHLFVSSLRSDGIGGYDLFGTRMKQSDYVLTFQVVEKKSRNPLSVPIYLEAATERPIPGATGDKLKKPTSVEGLLQVQVHPAVSRLQILVDADGYLPVQKTMDPREIYREIGETPTVLELEPIKEGASFDVRDIHFDYDSAKIKSESYPYLNDLLYYLKNHPGIQLEIIGHTDLHGAADYNKKLSLDRANAVKKFFTDNGLEAGRFQTAGAGMSRPVARGTREPYDSQNRRTEFKVLKSE